jgi:septal ring-binding cell division protein DamX
MTATAEPLRPRAATACANCGAPLADEQEWCLQCGQARSVIHRAPSWRIGAAIVIGVVALVAGITALALSRVSSSADQSAAAQLSGAPARAATTPASAPATPGARLLTWPAGLGGWTVVLSSSGDRAGAQASASGFAGRVPSLGILSSSEHPSMAPGYWVVFSGRYPTRADAEAAAASLKAQGDTSAHARMVEPPGGN